ncbi:hypothetical protein [Chitinivorax sp. B]|uniref:hypothetical protein n=1 Tax=Chitinivorax sp. B TaxID=2502235 RepID=UPI0010F98185|nr:hypothetical protein [Chitinivorax sp. B]
MFQTSWLTVFGLAVEILGLGFLFIDLHRSKTANLSFAEFQQKQGVIDATARELVVNLNKGLLSLTAFVSQYLSLLEMEAEFREDPNALTHKAGNDPAACEVLAFLQGKSPNSIRRFAVSKFAHVQADVPSKTMVDRALLLIEGSRTELTQMYDDALRETLKLRRIARLGIFFVALGASAQFIDLFFIDTPTKTAHVRHVS